MDLKITKLLSAVITVLFIVFLASSSWARLAYDADRYSQKLPAGKVAADPTPFVDYGVHDRGRIGLTVTNTGQLGTGFADFLGTSAPSCQYPYPSQANYLFAGAFWIGAVVGRDTLVSVAADGWFPTEEMWPDPGESPAPYGGAIDRHSIADPSDLDAVSEQDFIAVYTDTVTDPAYVGTDGGDGRPHQPLNIEVTQRSYAWSYEYAEDFVLFDYSIKNIGIKTLNQVYMGIYVDGDVLKPGAQVGFDDDICGFKKEVPFPRGCGFTDTINIAYIADNNGRDDDPNNVSEGCNFPAVTGVRVVRTPSDSLKYSFNWWISNGNAALDWGPRRQGTPDDPFRDFGGFLGTPAGDKNKYYVMRHEEFDYDQLFCALDHTSEGWLPRDPTQANYFADGYDTRYLLSFGPFDIDAGEVLPISFCYVAGDDFHPAPCNVFDDMPFDANNPQAYYDTLNFDDFGVNAIWASWIYDNPGVDTDGDGYYGKFEICVYDSALAYDTTCFGDSLAPDSCLVDTFYAATVADTIFKTGDDVPDFKGASPPPAPEMWIINADGDTVGTKLQTRILEHNEGEMRIRWSGVRSETTKDVFSDIVDFEGYNVYVSYAPQEDSYTKLASYDRENYNRWIWNKQFSRWELLEIPFTLPELKLIYGEEYEAIYGQEFDPFHYPNETDFLTFQDTSFFFEPMFWNQYDLSDPLGIHKAYPEVTTPPTQLDLDTARIYYPEELTDDGLFFKYYEYEYTLGNLLPSQLHYIAVTAFDFGSPSTGLPPLETPKNQNHIADYPTNTANDVEQKGLNVVVYPNPYRLDGNYIADRFEGLDYEIYPGYSDSIVVQENLNVDRTRSIHFANLPHKCTIRIFTIDGDLIREMQHNASPNAPQASHERWDLITRNTQSVVSGIYYYSVESEFGSQIGKLVIIM